MKPPNSAQKHENLKLCPIRNISHPSGSPLHTVVPELCSPDPYFFSSSNLFTSWVIHPPVQYVKQKYLVTALRAKNYVLIIPHTIILDSVKSIEPTKKRENTKERSQKKGANHLQYCLFTGAQWRSLPVRRQTEWTNSVDCQGSRVRVARKSITAGKRLAAATSTTTPHSDEELINS